MPTAMRINNENDVPIASSRPGKVGRKAFNVMDDIGKAEKRPRVLKAPSSTTTTTSKTSTTSTAAVRRPALGDVTNKLGVKRTTTGVGAAAAMKKQQIVKRTMQSIASKLVETTPVARTLGSLDLAKKNTPLLRRASQSPVTEPPAAVSHDIDSCNKSDAAACWQYAEDITSYQLADEKLRKPSAAYMSRQSDINSKMRAILVDWLVDVHCKYDLLPQTLHIASHLIDAYLSIDLSVPRQKLQLVGVTALFIASKYEEIYPPEADDFVRITDNAYTRDELFRMEEQLLAAIRYRVTFATRYTFLQRFLKAAPPAPAAADNSTATDAKANCIEPFAHYVIDRSLQEYKLIKYLPSTIAAASLHIARTQMCALPVWSPTLEYHSTYTETSLSDCIEDLKEMLWNTQNGVGKTSKLTAVRRKFTKERYLGVASHPLRLDA